MKIPSKITSAGLHQTGSQVLGHEHIAPIINKKQDQVLGNLY